MRKYDLKINDKAFKIEVKEFSTEAASLVVNDKPYRVEVSHIEHDSMKSAVARKPVPRTGGSRQAAPAPARAASSSGGAGSVTAPIPGKIMEVFVKEGDAVKVGQPVLKMEAMKMENVINSTADGVVGKVLVHEGDAVNQGQELILLG